MTSFQTLLEKTISSLEELDNWEETPESVEHFLHSMRTNKHFTAIAHAVTGLRTIRILATKLLAHATACDDCSKEALRATAEGAASQIMMTLLIRDSDFTSKQKASLGSLIELATEEKHPTSKLVNAYHELLRSLNEQNLDTLTSMMPKRGKGIA